MTTAIVYKGIMAVDSRCTEDNQLFTDSFTKYLVVDDMVIVAAGSAGECQAFMREEFLAELSWDNPVFPKKWVKQYLKHITAILYKKGEKHLIMTSDTRYADKVPINKEPMAIGSGSNFARSAAYALIKNTTLPPDEIVRESIAAAIKCDLFSGGNISIVNLKEI